MFTLSAELKAKGALAEAAFAAWLDGSGVPYMYVEQSPFTVPAGLKGRIKRPDYTWWACRISACSPST